MSDDAKPNPVRKTLRRVLNETNSNCQSVRKVLEMGSCLNVGNTGFSAIVKGLYVDKTEMISYINNVLGTMDKLVCVSRPRRFGKSYAAKMLCAYYDKSCDSRDLFANLKIAGDRSFEEHLNKYDVIYLDITWFVSNMAGTGRIKNIVKEIQKTIISEINEVYPQIERQDTLPRMLLKTAQETGNKFIIIIDEWDALFREAADETGIQEEYIQLLRGLFKSSGQTDQMIAGAYMTGILPIKKYGTQSAMTDFREYSMTQPEPLEQYVGFTEEEVRRLCRNSKLQFEDLQKWYDGYVLGNGTHIYSPQSVTDAMRIGRIGNYWTQSETYESLRIYIDLNEDGLKEAIVQMLGGASVKIDTATFQNDMTSIKSRDDVLTLLVHLGYLSYNIDKKSVSIPNEEIRQEFVRAVTAGRHTELAKLIKNSEQLLEATLDMNEEAVAKGILPSSRMDISRERWEKNYRKRYLK